MLMNAKRHGAMLTVLCAVHCGARTPLDDGDDGTDTPTPLADARIITLSPETFQGQSLSRGFDDMSGSGFVSYEGDGTLGHSCNPVLDAEGDTNQLSHVFIASDRRIHLGMLNDTHSVAVMDDMAGTGFASFSGPPAAPFINPCGIVARP